MNRSLATVAALAAIALGACTDAPTLPADASAANGLLVMNARSNAAEPAGVDAGRFNIEFRFLFDASPAQRAAFELAAARWERVIVRDVPSVSGVLSSCYGAAPVSTTTVDDIVIEVAAQALDGQGGALAGAAPCILRDVDGLPSSGLVVLDAADVASIGGALFDDVIAHEIGHALGVGTVWTPLGLVGGSPFDPVFRGRSGNAQWRAEGGNGPLPIESVGSLVITMGHWRENMLGDELMTGTLSAGHNPLSRITAASLRDIGYGVALAAERLALPGISGRVMAGGEEILDLARAERAFAPFGRVRE